MDDAALNIAFDELLGILRKAGFRLSPNDYVEFAAIFRQFNGTRDELKYFLAPVICRNSGDQQRFYQLYDKYTTPGPAKHMPPTEPVNNPYITEKTASHFLRISSRGFYAWLMGLLLFAVGFRTLLAHLYAKPRNAPSTAVTTPGDSVAPVAPLSNTRTFVLKTQKPVVRDPNDYSIVVPTGPEIEKVNSVHSSTFAWLFVLGSAAFILSLSFFPQRRSRSRPHVDIDSIDSDFGLLDIPLPPRDSLIRDLPVLAHIARDLAQPQPTEYSRLAIRRTISESIRADGLLTPVYEAIHRRPEYVFVIDSRSPLRAGLYRYLGRTLAKYSLPVYYYLGDGPDNFRADGSARRLSRYLLEQRHGDAQWIDFETGDIPAVLDSAFDFGARTATPAIADIQNWLEDEDLFQWLCALAVFPTVRWEVALAVGAAVLKQRGALHKLHFGSLLRFTQIGWLATSTGAIPPRIRLGLLQALGLEEELAARRAVLDLLRDSDDILVNEAGRAKDKLMQVHTQSFILFAHDTRKYKELEADARHFMNAWDREHAADLATVLYLSNPDGAWSTPVRSPEDRRPAGADKFMQELLALKVIGNPKVRSAFRKLSAALFFLLALIFLFADLLAPTRLNAAAGLVDHDYPQAAVTVAIPVTDCLRHMVRGHLLLVTLKNYDYNEYSQLLDLDGAGDTLRASFGGITMNGKDTSVQAFQLILNKTLVVDCPGKAYHSSYNLLLRGEDCAVRLPEFRRPVERRVIPHSEQQ